MKGNLVWTLASLFLLGACAPAGEIEVNDAWARPAAQGETALSILSFTTRHTQPMN